MLTMSSVTTLSTYVEPGASVFAARVANSNNPMLNLPDDLLFKIFGYCSPKDLAAVSDVSWRMHTRVSGEEFQENYWTNYDPRGEFPKLKIIDRAVWERVFGTERLARRGVTFDDVQPLTGEALIQQNKARRAAIKALHGLELVKNPDGTDPGITEITLPNGLNIDILVALVNEVAMEGAVFRGYLQYVPQEIKSAQVATTHQAVITNGILQGSENTTYSAKENLAKEKGGEMPTLLASMALSMVTYMDAPPESRIRLFGEDIYATCAGHTALGGFVPAGLYVSISSSLSSRGVGVLWKD